MHYQDEEENWDDDDGTSKTSYRKMTEYNDGRHYQDQPRGSVPSGRGDCFRQPYRNASHQSDSYNSYSQRGRQETNGWSGTRGSGSVNSYSRSSRGQGNEELYVPRRTVGLVIGKGGSKIRELQEISGAHIKVDKSGDYNATETLISLSGDENSIQHAKELILVIVNDPDNNRSFDSRTNSRRNEPSQNFGNEEEVYVPESYVAKIIGRGGSNIKDLKERSGAQIKVTNDSNEDDEIIVKISGDSGQIKEAKKLIDHIVNPYSSTYGNDEPIERIDWSKLKQDAEESRAKWLASLPEIQRNFYVEDPDVANMEEMEIDLFRKNNNNITVKNVNPDEDRDVPNPVRTFEQAFQHYPEILEEIRQQRFEKPSPIQCQAWPVVLQGIDLIGIAQTGTGKTIAFLLPALIHIENQLVPRSKRTGPTVLILAPTRELAQQIEREAKKYEYRGIKSVCIYGGGNRRDQVQLVQKGVEIVIATPGRLSDLVMSRVLDLSCITFLVLDEADRMLDMGFEPQINKILIDVRSDRQTVMTSATWPEEVRRLAENYTNNPIIVFIGTLDLAACHSVTQTIEMVDESEKRDKIYEFIDNMEEDHKVIIFVGKKAVADDMASDFVLKGIDCQSIHGDREQEDREQALEDIRSGYVKILVATDVASRGLDISDITHIYNYDFPRNVEEYVHRIGRTGRAGKTGESITLVTREDWRQAEELIKILVEADQEVPPELYDMAVRYAAHREKRALREGSGRGGGRRGGGSRRGGNRGFQSNRSDFY